MKNIPIEYLRSFMVIAELGSFTLAGERLARTQSAISLQIKKLEQLLGQPVFYRQGHNFELTQSGRILKQYATQILQLNDRLLGELNQQSLAGKVRLGIPSEFAIALLPKIVGSFSRQNPQVTLEVTCDLSRNLVAGLKKQRYDLVLSLADEPNDLEQYLKRDKLVWVASPAFQYQNQSPLPLIVAPDGCIYRKRALNYLEQAGIPWQIIYTIMDLSGMQAVIEEGLGVTVLAETTVPSTLNTANLPANLPALGSIGISLLQDNTNTTEAAARLAEHIQLHIR